MPSEQDTDAVKLARMQQQMASVVETVARIERKVDEVVTLDRTIVKLQSDAKHAASEMATQWGRIDSLQREVGDVDSKADKWINTARGAWWMLIVLGGAIQVAVAGSVAWVFSNVQDLREHRAVFENRLTKLENERPTTPPTPRNPP